MTSYSPITNGIQQANVNPFVNSQPTLTEQEAHSLFGAAGNELIESMGQKAGLPQSSIDNATSEFKTSFHGAGGHHSSTDQIVEELGQRYHASPAEIGDAKRKMDQALEGVMRDLNESDDVKEAKGSRGKGGAKGGGWLQAMANGLGKKLDQLADKMVNQSKAIDTGKPSASTDFTVTTQQFSMLMNAATNGIKTVGEAMAATARKG